MCKILLLKILKAEIWLAFQSPATYGTMTYFQGFKFKEMSKINFKTEYFVDKFLRMNKWNVLRPVNHTILKTQVL